MYTALSSKTIKQLKRYEPAFKTAQLGFLSASIYQSDIDILASAYQEAYQQQWTGSRSCPKCLISLLSAVSKPYYDAQTNSGSTASC